MAAAIMTKSDYVTFESDYLDNGQTVEGDYLIFARSYITDIVSAGSRIVAWTVFC